MTLPISACIIACNEEKRIAAALRSVAFCRETVVVDSGSTDRTVALCREHGARVIHQPFLGHIEQKNFALSHCRQDWVLSIDADEELSPALQSQIQALWEQGPRHDCYRCPRRAWFLGRWIRHGGWYPDRKVRLARRDRARWGGTNPHDKLLVDGTRGELTGDLLHYPFDDLGEALDAGNRYSTIQARQMFDAGRTRWVGLRLVARPAFKFLEVYLAKLGFLDGWPGLVIAGLSSYSVFARYAKLYELARRPVPGPSPATERAAP